MSLRRPKSQPDRWTGTFGDILCAEGGEAELTSIDYRAVVEPRSLKFLLHSGTVGSATAIASKFGGPTGLGGRQAPAEGAIVRTRCRENPRQFDELLLVIQAGTRGAMVDQVTLHYREGGQQFSTVANWIYAMCGTDVNVSGCE